MAGQQQHNPHGLGELSVRLRHVEEHIGEFRDVLQEMANAVKDLAVLNARHNHTSEALEHAFERINFIKHEALPSIDTRIRTIEQQMPTLQLASSWVFRVAVWASASIGAMGLAAVIYMLSTQGG